MSYPPYAGVDTYGQPLVDAWWTPGWNAQTKDYLVAPSPNGDLPGAPALTYVQVTGSFWDEDGSPLSGFMTFQPSDSSTITANGNTWRLPARLAGTTTISPYFTGWGWHQDSSGSIYLFRGRLVVNLMATDISGLVTDGGQPLTYTVIEHWLGGRKYSISVASADSGESQDISSLIVAGSVEPYPYDPSAPLQDQSALTTPTTPNPWS